MIAQVRCTILARGLKKNCEKLRKELDADKESIEKDVNHYKMICTTYFPCDELIDFSFEDLATEFSVDISYLFDEFSDQLCEYNEDYNLQEFLGFNGLSESGAAYGFETETGAVDDLKLLRSFLSDNETEVVKDSWAEAFEPLAEYDNQLVKEGKFMDQVAVVGFEASIAGFPRVRLAAEAGDEYAKTLLENFEKAEAEYLQ